VTIQALKDEFADPIFGEATLISTVIDIPVRGPTRFSPPDIGKLICFRLTVPLHVRRAPGKKLVFTPFNLFRMRQHTYANSTDLEVFARAVYHEFLSVLDRRLIPQDVSLGVMAARGSKEQRDSNNIDVERLAQIDSEGNESFVEDEKPSILRRFWNKSNQVVPSPRLVHQNSSRTESMFIKKEVRVEYEEKLDAARGAKGFEESPTSSSNAKAVTGAAMPVLEDSPAGVRVRIHNDKDIAAESKGPLQSAGSKNAPQRLEATNASETNLLQTGARVVALKSGKGIFQGSNSNQESLYGVSAPIGISDFINKKPKMMSDRNKAATDASSTKSKLKPREPHRDSPSFADELFRLWAEKRL